MESNRIMPVIRQFFGQSAPIKPNTRERSSQNGYAQQEKKKGDQQPTKEEAEQALVFLKAQDVFKKAGLSAEVREIDKFFVILVNDLHGNQLKIIRSADVFRLLVQGNSTEHDPVGHILDRRL